MKKFLLFLLSVSLCLESLAGGVHTGPWVSETRSDRVTILWTSDVPGMAYVELSDGTKVWETFAGRRVFHRLHSVRIDGLQPGQELRSMQESSCLLIFPASKRPAASKVWEMDISFPS